MEATPGSSPLRRSRQALRDAAARLKPLLIPTCILSGVYLLGISAILRANFNYIDDMTRVHTGELSWDLASRYLSDFFAVFLHADTYLTDVSPLPQIVAVVLLAAASVCVLRILTGKSRFTVWEYAAVLPLGLSPYMLSCLSFKYDAPYMTFSVLASVLPLLPAASRRDLPAWLLGLTAFAGTMAMCNTYQAASGILPMLTVLLAFKWWLEKEPWRAIGKLVAGTAAGYCATVVLYKVLLVHPLLYDYVSSNAAPVGQLVPHAAEVLRTYFTKILAEFDGKWLILSALALAAFLWSAVYNARRNRVLALVLAPLVLAVMALLSFGLYPVLEKPLINARSMYGSGAFLALVAVSAVTGKKALPGKLVCFALSWCFFVFTFTYGNALDVQKTYTEFRIEEVIDAIRDTDLELFSEEFPITFQIDGDIGYAPAIQGTMDAFPILRQLVPMTFAGEGWNTYGFLYYYGLPTMYMYYPGTTAGLTNFNLPLLDETIYHTIRGNQQFMLIELK